LGESIADAAHREVHEECSISIDLLDQIDLYELVEKDENDLIKYHYVVLDYLAKYKAGQLIASSDITDAKWIKVAEIDDMNCSASIKALVRKACENMS